MVRSCSKRNIYLLAALTVLLFCAFFSSCDTITIPAFEEQTEEPPKTVSVVLADDEGVEFSSDSRLELVRGDSLEVSYKIKDGYTVERIDGASLTDSGSLYIDSVNYSSTVVVKTRALRDCTLTCLVSDGGDGAGDGAGTVTADRYSCREGDTVTLTAVPAEDYAFAGYTVGKALCDGGEIISSSAVYGYVPSDSATVYANFIRAYATVKLETDKGISLRTIDTIKAEIGREVFFCITLNEGYEIESVDDGIRLDGSTVYVTINGDATYHINTKAKTKYVLQIDRNTVEGGTVKTEPDAKYGWEGDTVVITATPAESYIFNGFSVAASIANGGKLLTTDSTYTMTLTANSYIVANFELKTYKVTLKETEGISISSDKALTVKAGGSAEFSLTVSEDYIIDSVSDGAVYKDGKITLDNVYADTEISVSAHKRIYKHFSYASGNEVYGKLTADKAEGYYETGTVITLTATPLTGSFKCFTVNGKQVSTEKVYTFTLNDDTSVTAEFNAPPDPALTFTVPDGKWAILYHANGGVCSATTAAYYTEYYDSSFYHCPNAKPDLGVFTKSGYQLLGYSTEPDGSGDFYCPGWNVVMPTGRNAISLYCVWIKESPASDFSYTVSASTKTFKYSSAETYTGKYVTINSYKGSDTTVVIPEKINGYPVTNISAGTFINNKNITTLVMPKYIFSVGAAAMTGCTNFTTLYICDSFQFMPDTWYSNCPNFSQLYIRCRKMPTYLSGRNGTYSVKFGWLMTAPGKKIIIVSGSNSAYGIDSPLLESKLAAAGYTYSVVNYGQNASTPAAFYIEVSTHFMNPGDILIAEPEFTNQYQLGYNEINSTLWQIFDGAYDAFSYVDIRHYVKLFSSFAAQNEAASARTANKSYEVYTTDTVNAWGDYALLKVGATDSWKKTLDGYDQKNGSNSYKTGATIISGNASYSENGRTLYKTTEINRVYDMATAKGATVLFSMPTIVRTALSAASQIDGGAEQTAYINAVDKYLHATRISIPSKYIVGREYSYNSVWHINTAGQQMRTGYLAEDLIAYFKK